MRDFYLLCSMALAIAAGLVSLFCVRLFFVRMGIAVSVGSFCVGIAYFGYSPFMGGQYGDSVYFGCIAMLLGLLGFCHFMIVGSARWPSTRSQKADKTS